MDDEYLTQASKNPELQRDSIGKRELMFKGKYDKREKRIEKRKGDTICFLNPCPMNAKAGANQTRNY